MPDVKWTRSHRKKLHGFHTPHRLDPADVAIGADDAWAVLQAGSRRDRADPVIDLIGEDDQSRAVVASLWSEHDTGARPTTLDPVRECHRVLLATLADQTLGKGDFSRFLKWEVWQTSRILVGLWASAGVGAVIEILTVRIPFASFGRKNASTSTLHLSVHPADARGIPHGNSPMQHETLWWALRCHLSDLSEADFAAALSQAAPHYARLQASTEINAERNLTSLAFAFSRDGTWLREQATRLAGGDEAVQNPLQIVAGLTDPALALKCIERHPWGLYQMRFYAFDMLESLGPVGTIAVLERMCAERGARAGDKKKLQSVLKLAHAAAG